MIMLTVLAIPLLILLLLGVFIVSASAGTTHVTGISHGSATTIENTSDSSLSQLPFHIESWQADFSSLDTPAGE